jgi:YidC/Oxa1 family membrane protein insertase
MAELWRQFLVYPLLDVLILFYNTIAFQNLGVAVIEMTFLLRLALLPINIQAEKDSARYERLEMEVVDIQKAFKGDRIMANEHIRELLKKRKVSPWAKSAILIVQLLVLVVLYQVFLRGINAHLDHLAAWVGQPHAHQHHLLRLRTRQA